MQRSLKFFGEQIRREAVIHDGLLVSNKTDLRYVPLNAQRQHSVHAAQADGIAAIKAAP